MTYSFKQSGRKALPSTSATGAKVNVARRTGQELRTTCYNRPMRLHDYVPRPAHIKWLLNSDPAIRWHVMSGLTDVAPAPVAAERSRIDKRLVFKWLNNRPYFHGETEPCINGRILGLGAYFKEPNDALANQLLDEQLEGGGWNCEAWPFLSPKRPPSWRSSFHTTICVLEGLLDYERAGRKSAAVTKARRRAENYLLERRMFRSLRTGKVIDKRWLRFSFPTFWHYDVLRGLE